jgi:hypothetical protein
VEHVTVLSKVGAGSIPTAGEGDQEAQVCCAAAADVPAFKKHLLHTRESGADLTQKQIVRDEEQPIEQLLPQGQGPVSPELNLEEDEEHQLQHRADCSERIRCDDASVPSDSDQQNVGDGNHQLGSSSCHDNTTSQEQQQNDKEEQQIQEQQLFDEV